MDLSSVVVVGAIFWLICALIGALLASEKGRTWAGFWLGAGFGPIGIVIALLLPTCNPANADISTAAVADFTAFVKDQGKVGVSINTQDGRTIGSVSAGSPAAEAGVLPGDRLIAIGGELCEGDYRSVVMRLVGSRGTIVSITVRRGEDRVDFNLTRR
ncbi:MAG TPA: PDZ domain-containing protein [Blastocatellia bacterium]|nr:PDZ domain-containing protein [Blastocatellia bacterium]